MPAVAFVIMAVATAVSIHNQNEAKQDARDAAKEQKKSQAEQKALNAQKAAEERRQQIREERVRRAKVMQASENTGTEGSSGEIGAVGSLATQFQSNIGSNEGNIMHGQSISDFNQVAADFQSKSQQHTYNAQMWNSVASFSGSMFGGMKGK